VEINLFGLRTYFAESDDCVLITIPGVEKDWPEYSNKAWGIGITMGQIAELMTKAGLSGIEFTGEVMAGYSTGYRGVNLTIINQLVNLSALKRFVYYDAFYKHNDFPQLPKSHADHKAYNQQLTLWAVDTAIAASAGVEIAIYAYTPGGVPRIKGPNPIGPLKPLTKKHASNVRFLDFNFKSQGKKAIADTLEKICLARLIQGASVITSMKRT
jgi:hypothetical protein